MSFRTRISCVLLLTSSLGSQAVKTSPMVDEEREDVCSRVTDETACKRDLLCGWCKAGTTCMAGTPLGPEKGECDGDDWIHRNNEMTDEELTIPPFSEVACEKGKLGTMCDAQHATYIKKKGQQLPILEVRVPSNPEDLPSTHTVGNVWMKEAESKKKKQSEVVCSVLIDYPVFFFPVLRVNSYYDIQIHVLLRHFGVLRRRLENATTVEERMHTQVVLTNDLDDVVENKELLETWLTEFSEFPLRTLNDIPKDACFKRAIVRDSNYGYFLNDAIAHSEQRIDATDESSAADLAWYVDHILRKNRIDPTSTPAKQKLCMIQRKDNSVLLNLPELQKAASSMGVQMVSRVLEDVPPLKQIQWVKSCTVLMGVHGSGLLNAMFLSSKSTLVQLMPYRLYDSGTKYKRIANMFGIRYGEWQSDQYHNSDLDWALTRTNPELKRRMKKAEASVEALMKFGAKASDDDQDMDYIYYNFWRMQNLTMQLRDFRNVVVQSLKKSVYPNVKEDKAPLLEEGSSDSSNNVVSGLHLVTESRNKLTYLKFDLTPAKGAAMIDATLKMTCHKVDPRGKNLDKDGNVETIVVFNEVNLGDDDSWTLGSLTHGRPHQGPQYKVLGKWQVDTAWIVSLDVTAPVYDFVLHGV